MECGIGLCGHCQTGHRLRLPGRPRVRPVASSATSSDGRASDGHARRPAEASRRHRQDGLVRRLPAHAARPRGRAAGDRRATSTSSSSRRRAPARSAAPTTCSRGGRRLARREHAGADRRAPAPGQAPRHHRRLRHLRRHPGAAQLVRPRCVPGRGLRAPGVHRVAGHGHARVRAREGGRGAPRLPDQPRAAARGARRRSPIGRRAQIRDEAVCLECKRRGHASASWSPRAIPAWARSPRAAAARCARVPARLLRLLRPARAGQRPEPRAFAGRRPAARQRGRRGCSPGSPACRAVPRVVAELRRCAARRDRRDDRQPRRAPRGGNAMSRGDDAAAEVAEPSASTRWTSLTRVEGEGSLVLRVRDGEVTEARLKIFEAPRYFERLVVGRTRDEVIDIVARICGICPVAYQMTRGPRLRGPLRGPDRSASRGRSGASSTAASGSRAMRSTSTCSTPRTSSATRSARHGRRSPASGGAGPRDEEGRQPAHLGPRRPAHPPGQRPRRRRFSRVPRRRELDGLRAALDEGARVGPGDGRRLVASRTARLRARAAVSWRFATQPSTRSTTGASSRRTGVDIGPVRLARGVRGAAGRGHQRAPRPDPRRQGATCSDPPRASRSPATSCTRSPRRRWPRPGSPDEIRANIYRSHRRARRRAGPRLRRGASTSSTPTGRRPSRRSPGSRRAGVAAWSTEAPRGLLFHRYEVDEHGHVTAAQIVPPTSQNQAAIEADLRRLRAERSSTCRRPRPPTASSC